MHRNPRRTTEWSPATPNDEVTIRLLGRFEVIVNDTVTSDQGWTRRHAAALVKVLALAPGHRLHREQVLDLLWPDDSPADAAPKLHKAAHYARKAAGRDAVVLRNDVVLLFPSAQLTVDVAEFDDLSLRAVADSDPAAARAAIVRYAGELLPDDRYEDWAHERRELLRLRHLHLLRLAGQWVELSELDPCDEDAHVAVMRQHAANGDHDAALDQYARMERILDAQLGIVPGHEARTLRHDLETARANGPAPVVPLHLHRTPERSPSPGALVADEVAALVAELAELTRRQATLLEALAGAGALTPTHVCAAS